MITTIKPKNSWLLGLGLVGCLAGIALSWYGWRAELTLVLSFVALTPLLRLKRWWGLAVVSGLGLTTGLWRGGMLVAELDLYRQFYFQEVTFSGVVDDDPAYASEPAQLEFFVDQVVIGQEKLPGKIRVRSFANTILRGDRVVVRGKLYPGFASWQGSISYAEVEVIAHSSNLLESLRRNFFASIYSVLPEPQAGLGLGFLVGTRGLLPDALTAQLRRTGLTHIVAVSGYNLTILVRFARKFGAKLSKRLGFLLAITLVSGFLVVTGGSASVVRAAVVVAFALSAWYYGRRVPPLTLLLLSSAVTAMLNPLFFWFDLGWWLSFAAFFGVLIMAPLLRRTVFGRVKNMHWLPRIALETTSAQLMTIPLTLTVFGEFSTIALLANVIILPLVPFAMLFSFIAGVVGMISTGLGYWLAWPAQTLLRFMTEVIEVASRPDWAFITDIDTPATVLPIGYMLLICLSMVMYMRLRRRQKVVFTDSVIE